MTNEQFTGLIRQYEKLVFTVCYQLVRDYHEAQNLAQDTFLSAYRNIDRCPPESYRPWLCRIAANKAKDFLKSAYNQRVVMEGEEILEAIPANGPPDELAIEQEGAKRIETIIRTLKEPYRNVSILFFLELRKSPGGWTGRLKRFKPSSTAQNEFYSKKSERRNRDD